MEQQDLNAEYGRIFGVVHYPTLFDKDDSAYSGSVSLSVSEASSLKPVDLR